MIWTELCVNTYIHGSHSQNGTFHCSDGEVNKLAISCKSFNVDMAIESGCCFYNDTRYNNITCGVLGTDIPHSQSCTGDSPPWTKVCLWRSAPSVGSIWESVVRFVDFHVL